MGRRNTAAVVRIEPSADFVPPMMALDLVATYREPGEPPTVAPLHFEKPTFDYPGETKHQRVRRERREWLIKKSRRKTLLELFDEVPCSSCEQGYGQRHRCDFPDYCECDQHHLHDNEGLLDGEEAVYEFGAFEPVTVIGLNGQTYVRGPDGKICRHPEPVMVHLSDGTLVAWICERCGADGRFPWP